MNTIRSYQDYVDEMSRLLPKASYETQLAFCTKCTEKIYIKYTEDISEELSEKEQKCLSEIMEYLNEQPPLFDQKAKIFRDELSRVAQIDVYEDPELDQSTICVLSCFEGALEYIMTGKTEWTQEIGDQLINDLDYNISGDYELYTDENMFIFPEMKAELDWQLSLIN